MSMDKNKKILPRILEVISEKGLNKTEVADITGYSRSQVGDVLEGRTPLAEKFVRIFALSFKISEQWLRDGSGNKYPEPEWMKMPLNNDGGTNNWYRQQEITPYMRQIITLMADMDEDTQKDICLSVEKEKLLRDLLRQKDSDEKAS